MDPQDSNKVKNICEVIWNHENLDRTLLHTKYRSSLVNILVNSLFCKLFKHSFCFVVRQGSHLRLCCGLTQHTNSKTQQLRRVYCLTRGSRRPRVEISPLTLRTLSLQKGRWSSVLRAPLPQRWVGLHMQVARCQDTTTAVKVQTATKVPGYVFSYLSLVMQLIFTGTKREQKRRWTTGAWQQCATIWFTTVGWNW